MRNIESQTSVIEYFGDDENDALNRKIIDDKYFFHKHTVNFSIARFLEFFVLHLLAYGIIGPLINIYSIIYPESKFLLYNLNFLRFSKSFLRFIFEWLVTLALVCLFFF